MNIWAIADLHLSFGVPNKKMDLFGKQWLDHDKKIAKDWVDKVSPDDLVLIAGDISWALKWEQVEPDLAWIDQLPGTKVMIKGNHDYWWPSLKKLQEKLPQSIHAIYGNSFDFHDVSIAGSRLWDTDEYHFSEFVEVQKTDKEWDLKVTAEDMKKFQKELTRLERSLSTINADAKLKIAMTHYPPISADLKPSQTSTLLEKYHIDHVLFGHLHSIKKNSLEFGERNNVHYHLTACDYLDFKLKLITSL